jgi:hypothetical protein
MDMPRKEGFPQVFMPISYEQDVKPTPTRPVDEILL